MIKIERILHLADQLPAAERRRLIRRLAATRSAAPSVGRTRLRRIALGKPRRGGVGSTGRYPALLELAGQAHSIESGVARNKHRHLAEIYADLHRHR